MFPQVSLQTHTNLLSPPFPSLLPPQQQKNNYPHVTLDSKSTISSSCFHPEFSSSTHSAYKTSILLALFLHPNSH